MVVCGVIFVGLVFFADGCAEDDSGDECYAEVGLVSVAGPVV